jgi:hypothetical protein
VATILHVPYDLKSDSAFQTLQERKRKAYIGYDHGYHCTCNHQVGFHDAKGCHHEGCGCTPPPPCACGHPDICHKGGYCYECSTSCNA